jgi:hypothetical protein
VTMVTDTRGSTTMVVMLVGHGVREGSTLMTVIILSSDLGVNTIEKAG